MNGWLCFDVNRQQQPQPTNHTMKRYKLNIERDVDFDEPNTLILNLPKGYRFDVDFFDPRNASHVQAFDSLAELKEAIAEYVIPCECNCCR